MRRRTAARTLALLLALRATAVAAGQPPVVTVNRQEVITPIVHPEKRGNEWYLPAQPIARALHSDLFFDRATSSVTVTNPVDASVVVYDGISGEVRRNQALDLALAPGLAAGADEADLRLPLSLVTILFDLHAHVTREEDEITLLSRRSAGSTEFVGLSAVGVQELDYHGYANRGIPGWDGGLRVDNRTRLGRGRLRSSVFAQAAESVDPVLRSYSFSYLDGRGNELAVGDLRGTPDFRWLDSYGRGGQWAGERGDGRHRFSVDFRRLVAGQVGAPGRASRPTFEGEVASVAYTFGARPGARAGRAFSAGLAIQSDVTDEPGGVLLGVQHRHASRRLRSQTMAGVFESPGRRLADAFAAELNLEWMPVAQLRLNTRFGHYGPEFRLPTSTFAERASRFWTVGGRGSPRPAVTLSASHTIREDLPLDAIDYLTTGSASFATGGNVVRNFSVSVHSSDIIGEIRRNDVLFDARGSVGRANWFGMVRETLRDGHSSVFTTGVSTRTRVGIAQVTGSWQGGRLQGVAAYWTRPLPGQPSLRANVGGRWGRERADGGLDFLASVRLTWSLARSHEIDWAWDQHRSHDASRLTWHGAFRFDEARMGTGSLAVPAPHIAEIRGRVYLDEDLDGAFSRGDIPLPGIRIRLDRGHLWTETSETGEYSFQGIRAGPHEVTIDATTVRADLALLDDIGREVLPGSFRTAQVDWRVSRARTVHGLVFRDRNGNGRLDDGEPGVANVRVLIAGGGDTVSGPEGHYRLGDVAPGVRILVVDQSSLENGDRAPDPIELRLAPAGDPQPVHLPIRPPERPTERKIFLNP